MLPWLLLRPIRTRKLRISGLSGLLKWDNLVPYLNSSNTSRRTKRNQRQFIISSTVNTLWVQLSQNYRLSLNLRHRTTFTPNVWSILTRLLIQFSKTIAIELSVFNVLKMVLLRSSLIDLVSLLERIQDTRR